MTDAAVAGIGPGTWTAANGWGWRPYRSAQTAAMPVKSRMSVRKYCARTTLPMPTPTALQTASA
jgi:hypothetical protein